MCCPQVWADTRGRHRLCGHCPGSSLTWRRPHGGPGPRRPWQSPGVCPAVQRWAVLARPPSRGRAWEHHLVALLACLQLLEEGVVTRLPAQLPSRVFGLFSESIWWWSWGSAPRPCRVGWGWLGPSLEGNRMMRAGRLPFTQAHCPWLPAFPLGCPPGHLQASQHRRQPPPPGPLHCLICVCIGSCLWHLEVHGPGIEPTPQQEPESGLRKPQTLTLLSREATPNTGDCIFYMLNWVLSLCTDGTKHCHQPDAQLAFLGVKRVPQSSSGGRWKGQGGGRGSGPALAQGCVASGGCFSSPSSRVLDGKLQRWP